MVSENDRKMFPALDLLTLILDVVPGPTSQNHRRYLNYTTRLGLKRLDWGDLYHDQRPGVMWKSTEVKQPPRQAPLLPVSCHHLRNRGCVKFTYPPSGKMPTDKSLFLCKIIPARKGAYIAV